MAVGGNIGIPALDLLDPEIDLYILELSSFQLETTFSLHADIATILNISEDHMDRYDSYAQYTAAKHRIYKQCKMALYNRDDKLTYPKDHRINKTSFGFDKCAYGLITAADKQIFLAKNGSPIFAVKNLRLSGKHNWMNALAALALGDAVGLSATAMLTTLQEYSGLPHRCEFVAEINHVSWVNDSKATNIGAAQAALLGLSETIAGKVHVILGGDGKGADFSELAPVLKDIQGMIVCFGVDGPEIAAQNKRALLVETLDQAVDKIYTTAQAGDLVILSPACASLDMYKNFMQRGEHFKRLVKALN
ncbi:MAG: UDP-N-acetylmuramoylalanine--D-glutamate ligase [Sphingobacteriales bacterium]